MKKYYTVEEAAEYLGTGVRFVRRLIAERRIPFHKVGKFVRLKLDDLEAFADAGRVEVFDRGAVRRHVRRAS
ncbi:helix-turn-helix domain-containing protein [Actinophytocola sp.]|uniref:helix-turn-helix domain-containing protein n=1 Tax=Actinophytocola sp. TaxID=1872138 RepID=UPI003899F177